MAFDANTPIDELIAACFDLGLAYEAGTDKDIAEAQERYELAASELRRRDAEWRRGVDENKRLRDVLVEAIDHAAGYIALYGTEDHRRKTIGWLDEFLPVEESK